MTRDQETILLQRWLKLDDQDAANEFWREATARLKISLRRIMLSYDLDPEDDLRDILSETFMTFDRQLKSGEFRLDGPGKPSTYCFEIAKYEIKKLREKRTRKTNIERKYATLQSKRKKQDALKILIKKETLQNLVRAISELPNDKPNNPLRDIFCLFHGCCLENDRLVFTKTMTQKEIAELYGLKRSWAQKKYTKAKNILMRKLESDLDEL